MISFGIAVQNHMAGAGVDKLLPERFSTYDEANHFAGQYRTECDPTIYVILNEEYAFNCERSAVQNKPYKVYHLQTFEEGQIETRIWWADFVKNPEKFLHLGQKIPKSV